MKRFRFSLQALLVVRQRQEQVALERYAHALGIQRRAAAAVEVVEAESRQAAEALRSRMGCPVLAGELSQRGEHLKALDLRRARALHLLAEAERGVQPALEQVWEARRQRGAVEKFQERQRERHRREGLREEGRMLDELAQRRLGFAALMPGPETL